MILIWVMSLVTALSWAIVQLESSLALEIRTQALVQRSLDQFQRTEEALLNCEIHLMNLTRPEIQEIGLVMDKVNHTAHGSHCHIRIISAAFYEVQSIQGMHLRSVLMYQAKNHRFKRISWQRVYE
jgi:hypothetical protein